MEKDRSIIFFAVFFTCLANAAWANLAINNTISGDPLGDIMNRINDVACIFLTLITYIASGISAIIIIYAGVKYMTSQDAEQTTNAKNMIIYAIAGLALILLACPIVDYLIIGTKIVPFQEKCNCFWSSNGSENNTLVPPVPSNTTTSTSTTTTSTMTSTLTDHTICYNAGEDTTVCAALNYLPGGRYQQDCCTEWKCCCIPSSGKCTHP